jgi:REP-associated tyrosine transposase
MLTGKPPHLKTFAYVGLYRYFLTFCTHGRRRHFTTAEPVAVALSHILQTAREQHFAILAYCFMPDHLHLLIEAQVEDADCRQFISRSKQFSGFYFRKTFGDSLWQRYGYERTLKDDEATLSVVRYILENPLRAGLVRAVGDYPFSGSSAYSIQEVLEAVQLCEGWSG